jgi:hypothetical protein
MGITVLKHYADFYWLPEIERKMDELDKKADFLRKKYLHIFTSEGNEFFNVKTHPKSFWWRKL